MAQQFLGELEEIYTGAQGGAVNRWSATNFFDKVLFAHASIPPIYWPGTFPYQSPVDGSPQGLARQIPGLPSVGYDGVEVVAGHVVFWKGELLKWSDLNDFTNYIPVGETAVSLVTTTQNSFEHPAAGFETDNWIHLDESDTAFVVGQFVRVEAYPNDPTQALYHFYEVSSVSSPEGIATTSLDLAQTVPGGSTGTKVFTDEYSAWGEGSKVIIGGEATDLEVVASSRDLTGTFTSNLESDRVPEVGSTFRIRVAENPSSLKIGDVLSVGGIAKVGLDLYEVVRVAFYLELRRLGVGTERQATNFRFPSGTYLTFQPFVTLSNSGTSYSIAANTDLAAQLAVKLKGLGLTGEAASGTTIPEGVSLSSLDANEAGEAVNAGSSINGNIFAVVSLGEGAAILKERSIQSMQYTGRASGTFFIRPEIMDEGPISKPAWCRAGDRQIAFLGHKNELYLYSGGQILAPVAQQHSSVLFDELDRSRSDEIVMFYNETDQEIWIYYPALNSETLKIFIYNTKFGSVVEDHHEQAALGTVSAFGAVDWEIAPTWSSLPDTLFWIDETRKWYEFVDEGLQRYTLMGVSAAPGEAALGEDPEETVPRILLFGRKFSRASGDNCNEAAYTALAETPDYDFGDGSVWKYADTLQLDLEIEEKLARPVYLYVQLGARNTLDSDIRWSTPSRVEISGNSSVHTKINCRMAGRFLRIRFYSNSVGAKWRIAGFKLMARAGGTY